MRDLLTATYRYRGFIWSSVERDFQTHYQTSIPGALWLVLQPLSMILVYTLVFSEMMKARIPDNAGPFAYSIYLCPGVLTWGLFVGMLDRGQSVFINNANLIKKLSFPKICLPVIVTLSTVLNFAITFSLFLIFIIATGNFSDWLFLSAIPVLLLQTLSAGGLGMILSMVNAFFRDVRQLVGATLQFQFWFTPIVYILNSLPTWTKNLLPYNPMIWIMQSCRFIFAYHQAPSWYSLWSVLALTIISYVIGFRAFRKRAADMVGKL